MKPMTIIPALLLLLVLPFPPGFALAGEAASGVYKYRQHEASTGYYEQYEVLPGLSKRLLMTPRARGGVLSFGPGAARVRIRTRLDDAHRGIRFYEGRTCVDCHLKQGGDNLHVVRNGILCRQCHGIEPIAAVEHYYSPLNRIRRHAYVCAKCHQGAGISFAAYLVHEPNPAAATTRESFPMLYYAFWIMAILAAGTFLVFLPHTALWGLRELLRKKPKQGDEP